MYGECLCNVCVDLSGICMHVCVIVNVCVSVYS